MGSYTHMYLLALSVEMAWNGQLSNNKHICHQILVFLPYPVSEWRQVSLGK